MTLMLWSVAARRRFASAMSLNDMISCGVLPVSRFIRSPKYPGERLAFSAKYDTFGISVSTFPSEYISAHYCPLKMDGVKN